MKPKPLKSKGNPVAKALSHPVCRCRVIRDRSRYTRKPKHKQQQED